jgi:hypothetical protein
MIPAVIEAVTRERLLQVLLWAACAVLIAGALVGLIVPRGGQNRIGPAALPFLLGAAALAAQALKPKNLDLVIRSWATALLFAFAGLATFYGLLLVAAVPLRLSVEGSCPTGLAACPIGFERPLTSTENFALQVTVVVGLIAMLLIFMAVELYYRPRLRVFGRRKPPDPGAAGGSASGGAGGA